MNVLHSGRSGGARMAAWQRGGGAGCCCVLGGRRNDLVHGDAGYDSLDRVTNNDCNSA